jgi:diguanylate cyclase (GGDEF)-like protein
MTEHDSSQEDFQRLSRALRTLSGSNRALLRVEGGEAALLQEICRVIVEEAGYSAAVVSRAEDDAAKTITPLARAGSALAYEGLRDAAFTWADTEEGRSATGTAIRTGLPCVVNDLESGVLSTSWRDFARNAGAGALLALPLHVDGHVFGALTILAPEAAAFCVRERAPLLEAAEDLSFGLRILRARERHAQVEAQVRQMTYFDPVSGLPNRLHLRELLAEALLVARERHQPLALLRIELERYGEIEEALGDADADALVRIVTGRLKALVEPAGTLTQVADGEFAALMPAMNAEAARLLSQRIHEALGVTVEVGKLLLDARATLGITLFPGHGTEAEILFRRAGIAQGHARRTNKAMCFYREGLDQERGRHIALMADLRRAIERDELRLYCQPKVRVDRRSVCGAEALVRWMHPTLGMLNPGEFIALAESAGLITPLTQWVMDATLRQVYEWREQGISHPMAMNLSARDLRDPRLLDRIGDGLATWGVAPGSIEFELTESSLMEDPVAALETLQRLKRLDVSLTIDDYGTGYSSLSYLRRLPVDAIKIDQSFVTGMATDRNSAMIVRSTIALAHNLDLKVVAEGVEDPQTLACLADWGCDMAQGYSIGRPMPAQDFGAWADGAGGRHLQ